jgi:hypothetical protein
MTNKVHPSEYTLGFYTINSEVSIKKYNRILKEFKRPTLFYSLQYCGFSSENILNYFILSENNSPKILMPFFLNEVKTNLLKDNNKKYYDVTSPYGYSGPLFNKNINDEVIKIFWKYVDNWYKENNVITEFIRFNLNNNHEHYTGHLVHTLNNIKGHLTNFELLWTNFKQKVRNNYRKAKKYDLKIKLESEIITQKIIDDFYLIYIKTMERKTASETYFYSKNHFINLIDDNKGKVLIAFVYKDSVPISTEFIIFINDSLYSYLGGTLSEYFNLRPNDFLKIEVIKWALKNNKTYYILGGGRIDYDSLYQYKKSFFPKDEDVIFYTGRKIINQNVYKSLISQIGVDAIAISDSLTNTKAYFPLYRFTESEYNF